MYPKRSGEADRPVTRPLRSSDRLRRRPKVYGRPYLYYTPTIIRNKKSRTKTRTAASRIAKMLRSGDRPVRTSNGSVSCTLLFDCIYHAESLSGCEKFFSFSYSFF